MYELTPYSFDRGMGQLTDLQTQTLEGGVIGSSVGSAIGTAVGGPVVGQAVGAAVQGVTQLISAVEGLFKGCGATCTEATKIVNQVEPYLQENNRQYFTNPNRTTADQAQAIATAQKIFAIVQQQCGNPNLGAAGQRCISDRFGSGCAMGLTSANEYPPYSSVPYSAGVCWNWPLAYLEPIQNDVPPGGYAAVPSTSSAGGTVPGVSSSMSSMLPWLLIAGLVLFAVSQA